MPPSRLSGSAVYYEWCDVMWCGVVGGGVVWCGVVWCGVVWCDVMWHIQSFFSFNSLQAILYLRIIYTFAKRFDQFLFLARNDLPRQSSRPQETVIC